MSEDYLRSIDDPEGMLDCFRRYGAVGVTGILTRDECRETVDDLMRIAGCDFDDPSTYRHATPMNRYGVIGKDPLFTETLNRNRFHPNVQKAYSILYQRPAADLLAQFDRAAWMRPVIGPGGEKCEEFDTPFVKPGLHLDLNPKVYFEKEYHRPTVDWLNAVEYDRIGDFVKENNCKNIEMGRHLQGVLNLLDNYESNGGFQFVPGGYEKTEEWYRRDSDSKRFEIKELNDRFFFDSRDYDFAYPERLPCPAGTMIIFDAALPHGTRPNRSADSRMIQFIRYIPRSIYTEKTLKRRRKLLDKCCREAGIARIVDVSV